MNEVYLNFPIPTENLNFGPLHVTEAALNLGFGETGAFVQGYADVAIDQIGRGRVEGRIERGGPVITGTFGFDMDFLNPAEAAITYRMADDTLTLTLTAGVQQGRLPGVESGTITGTFSREAIAISGTLNLGPPLAGTSLTLSYTPETGLLIAANDIPLPLTRIPGVKDARASVAARRDPDTGAWKLSGSGSATIDIPPATGTLGVAINGKAMTITGTANFVKGPASGSINFTATNQAVDADGNPVEGEAGETFTLSGRGTASMTFGILTGTAAIEVTPEGRMIVSGSIALPPTHEVFARRAYERELLHVSPPEFPIWGVSVAGYGIGIFAFLDAYLRFDAFVGPGTLQNTAVGVQFDLDKPEEAVVDGHAEFVVPAGAGFTLDIGGGLRARVAIASIEGRVGLDARLGLAAEARAGVDLHWTEADGLSLAAGETVMDIPVRMRQTRTLTARWESPPGFNCQILSTSRPIAGRNCGIVGISRIVSQHGATARYERRRECDLGGIRRFYALRMQETGLSKLNPQKVIAEGTDGRFLNEIKRELKT